MEGTPLAPTRTNIPSSGQRRAQPKKLARSTMTPKRALQAIIGKSLAWGFAAGGIVFLVGFIGPLIVTPEANLGPLSGIFLGPVAFVIGTFLTGIYQIRRALTLPRWGKVVYGLFLLLLLVPFALSGTDLLSAGVYSAPLALFFALMTIIRWVINTISY